MVHQLEFTFVNSKIMGHYNHTKLWTLVSYEKCQQVLKFKSPFFFLSHISFFLHFLSSYVSDSCVAQSFGRSRSHDEESFRTHVGADGGIEPKHIHSLSKHRCKGVQFPNSSIQIRGLRQIQEMRGKNRQNSQNFVKFVKIPIFDKIFFLQEIWLTESALRILAWVMETRIGKNAIYQWFLKVLRV